MRKKVLPHTVPGSRSNGTRITVTARPKITRWYEAWPKTRKSLPHGLFGTLSKNTFRQEPDDGISATCPRRKQGYRNSIRITVAEGPRRVASGRAPACSHESKT